MRFFRFRRGGTLALVLCLYLALGAVLLGALTVSTASARAADREYRRSAALSLAEASVAEAQAGEAAHGERPLGTGVYSWSETASSGGRLVLAHGSVPAPGGIPITRTVRVLLAKHGGGWDVKAWGEGN